MERNSLSDYVGLSLVGWQFCLIGLVLIALAFLAIDTVMV